MSTFIFYQFLPNSVLIIIDRYCGSTLPTDIISTTEVALNFRTDASNTHTGFRLTYTFARSKFHED